MDDPPPPGFDRVVISCRTCRGVETLDLQAGVMTPERLSIISPRCSECGSSDVEVAVESAAAGGPRG
jgi:Zn finger protein HypA/HybF involved in hydrogenase expression